MKKKFSNSAMKNEFKNFFCFLIKLFIIISLLFSGFITMNAQWESVNNGLGDGAIHCFLVEGNNIYTGTVWGVFITTDNGNNWTAKNNGFKGRFNTDIESLAISGNNFFAGTILYGIFLSTDKGENWVQKSNGLPYHVLGIDTVISVEVYKILINGNNIFAGTENGVYISTDSGENWNLKNNGLPQFDTLKRDVYSIVVSGNNIYAGTRYGVYMTTDNGGNWTPKNNGLPLSDTLRREICSMAISGHNIYVGTLYGGVFLSTDNGDNWKNIGLKDTIIAAIIIKGNYILAGGGFYISSNNGNDWTTYLYDVGILSIIIKGDYVFAGTSDYGIFRAKLSDLGITDVKEPDQKNECIIYPNPASNEFRLKFESTSISKIQISIFDLLGKEVFSSSENCNIGMNEKVIDCRSLGTGYYIIRLKQNDKVKAKPLLILK